MENGEKIRKTGMRLERSLAMKNLRRRPGRTAALVLLTAFLSLSVFAGSVIVSSLRNGLASYGDRLGADVVAVPYEATTKKQFESILLQGIPGTFYMDGQYYEKIAAIDGVEVAAPQFYLASTSAGCCSVPVQIIGFDPALDFTVQPWIRDSYESQLGYCDIIIGSDLTLPADGTLTFFNTECRVVAQLDKTGTGLDTAVYGTMETIKTMIRSAQELGFSTFDDIDPDNDVSAVLIRVAEGYDAAAVTADINVHVRHVEAEQTTSMLSGIAGGLESVSRIVGVLTAMVWILAVVILAIAFAMIARERTKEFGILRVMGASRKMVSRALLTESLIASLAGAVIGLAAGLVIVIPFSNLIGSSLGMPYLMPGAAVIALIAAMSLVVSALAGSLTAAVSAWRAGKVDAGLVLREGA